VTSSYSVSDENQDRNPKERRRRKGEEDGELSSRSFRKKGQRSRWEVFGARR